MGCLSKRRRIVLGRPRLSRVAPARGKRYKLPGAHLSNRKGRRRGTGRVDAAGWRSYPEECRRPSRNSMQDDRSVALAATAKPPPAGRYSGRSLSICGRVRRFQERLTRHASDLSNGTGNSRPSYREQGKIKNVARGKRKAIPRRDYFQVPGKHLAQKHLASAKGHKTAL